MRSASRSSSRTASVPAATSASMRSSSRRRTATRSASAHADRSRSTATWSTACPTIPVKDVAPIALFGSSAIVLWVSAESPAKTMQDFVAAARSQPGKLNYASDGIGTTNHLGGEALRSAAKIDVVHVPYKGTAEAITALLQGDVHIFPGGLPPLVGPVQGRQDPSARGRDEGAHPAASRRSDGRRGRPRRARRCSRGSRCSRRQARRRT